MDATTIIEKAAEFILARDIQIPDSQDDRYFLGDVILRLAEVLSRYGAPTIEMRNVSIEIGGLTRADCQGAHITLRTDDQTGRRTAGSFRDLTYKLTIAEDPKPSRYGKTYAFDVCQAFPAFITALHEVHTAGFTANAVEERAKAYWLAAFGFWG